MASTAVAPRQESRLSGDETTVVRVLASVGAFGVSSAIIAAIVFFESARQSIGVELLAWALLASLGGLSTIDFGPGRPALSMDLPVLLACAYSEGAVAAGLVALVGTYDQFELRGRTSVARLLWNHSQTALSVLAAGWVFHALGGIRQELAFTALASAVALAADALVNYTSVASLQTLISGDSFRRNLEKMRIGATPGFLASYVSFGLLALLMAEAYHLFSFGGVVVCLAPLLLAREAFQKSLRVEQEVSRGDSQALALARVDERIADERHDERSQIAAALHDDVLQGLFNVRIRAEVIREDLRTGRLLDLENDVPAVVQAAEQAADELRGVIRGLRRSAIGRTGLLDTVVLLSNHLRDESGMNFILDLRDAAGASPELELLGYQILREAMTNACRHSHADSVWVSVRKDGPWLLLEVVDNGSGFDAASTLSKPGNHFGLPLMRERASQAGGQIEIRSRPGEGAVMFARLPLQ